MAGLMDSKSKESTRKNGDEREREKKKWTHQQEMRLGLMLKDVPCWTIFIKEIVISRGTIKEIYYSWLY